MFLAYGPACFGAQQVSSALGQIVNHHIKPNPHPNVLRRRLRKLQSPILCWTVLQ